MSHSPIEHSSLTALTLNHSEKLTIEMVNPQPKVATSVNSEESKVSRWLNQHMRVDECKVTVR